MESENTDSKSTSKVLDFEIFSNTDDASNVTYELQRSNSIVEEIVGDLKKVPSDLLCHAEEFLRNRKISELFNFLIGHLLVHEPEDPIEFMFHLLDKCILFRSGLGEAPLLFNFRHIENMFRNLDHGDVGMISLDQYKIGLNTLGIHNFNPNPPQCQEGFVEKNTFETEAMKCLLNDLTEMLGKPC